jgi:geranylgeranyl pyrophosphate synthase
MSRLELTPFEEVLAAGGEEVRLLMDEIEAQLVEVTGSYGAALERLAGATLAAGGKRLRPLLVLLCGAGDGAESGEESGKPGEEAGRSLLVRAGGAVELVHMASLVHDDVVDDATLRRGHPTVFAEAGRDAAVTTGDFLFSRAFALLSENGAEHVRVLSCACRALAAGELVQRQDAYARLLDVERYLYRCDLKTASLFGAACRLGALGAGRHGEAVEALTRYGGHLGLAFQLLDDALDVAGDPARTGKRRGGDLLDGTVTLPLILARRIDPGLATVDLRAIGSPEEAEEVCDRIAATEALSETRQRAEALVRDAKAELGSLPKPAAELLELVADRVVDRYS